MHQMRGTIPRGAQSKMDNARKRPAKGPAKKATKRERILAAGHRVGSVQELLGLTDEEMEMVEMRRALLALEGRIRARRGVSQEKLAKQLGSSKSRISKMENDDASVSIALILRAILTMGGTRREIGDALIKSA